MPEPCALCIHLGLEPRQTTNTVGLRTGIPSLLRAGVQEWEASDGGDPHIVVPVCPEHAVDVYRGRLAGVAMAWRVPAGEAHALTR